jgi:hypothetical protein
MCSVPIICYSDTASAAVDTFGIQVRFTSADATDCVMLGSNSAVDCSHVFEWPLVNSDILTNGQTTSNRTDVQSAEYSKGVGDYTVSAASNSLFLIPML